MKAPKTQFTNFGQDRIGYQVLGDGPIDLIVATGSTTHVDVKWENPIFADFHHQLAAFTRLIMFDSRGCGVSDPLPPDTTFAWESWVDDLGAVMDAVGSERAAILGGLDAGPSAILFAATKPERVSALILAITTARIIEAPDYPEGMPEDAAREMFDEVKRIWGTEEFSALLYPDRASDAAFMSWYAKYTRACASPRIMAEHLDQIMKVDIRHVLPILTTPTLVLHRASYPFVPIAQGRYLADHIAGAKFVETFGQGGLYGAHGEETTSAVREFLTGAPPETSSNRVLATILFTDIVGSTDKTAELGDRRWLEALKQHDHSSRSAVEQHGGRLITKTGDGILATFDAPTRAARCALAIQESMLNSGLEVRAAIHTGEIELVQDDVAGMGINIAARVLDHAGAREIITTRTVRDLASGADLVFTARGSSTLRGVPEQWELFEVTPG